MKWKFKVIPTVNIPHCANKGKKTFHENYKRNCFKKSSKEKKVSSPLPRVSTFIDHFPPFTESSL